MKHTLFQSLLARAFNIPLHGTRSALPTQRARSLRSPFSTTPSLLKKGKGGPGVDKRVKLITYFLHHPAQHQPRPLRFSRLRALRHWTITRAWSLLAAQRQRTHRDELQRQWTAMRAACEELRTGAGDGGRLFRQATTKKGVWGGRSDLGRRAESPKGVGEGGRVPRGQEAGIPIEYARGLVETPPRGGWYEGWTRG